MLLISLLGDDLSILSPIINEYKNQISHHILIHDDAIDDIRRAIQFKQGIIRFCKKNNFVWNTSLYRLDEDSKNDIIQLYKTIREKHSEKILLHSSEGLASLAFILSNLVLEDGGEVISFDPIENEINHLSKNSLTTRKIDSKLNIDNYVTMLNFNILSIRRSEEMEKNKHHVQTLFADYKRFLELRDALVNKQKNFDYDKDKDLLAILKKLNVVDEKYKLISSQQQYLQGGLFEEYIFWLVKSLNFDDVALGVKIDFEQLPEDVSTYRIINEFDILIANNNRIQTIECKMVKNLDGLAYIYKYDAIIDIFGKGTKAILLNISPKDMEPYLDSHVSSNFNAASIRRGKMKNIEIYHDSDVNTTIFTNFVNTFFRIT